MKKEKLSRPSMKSAYLTVLLFTILCSMVIDLSIAVSWAEQESVESTSALDPEQKRFDLNNDGELDQREADLPLEVVTKEVFIGQSISSDEIRSMMRGGRGGKSGFPGMRQHQDLIPRFDVDQNGRLNPTERQLARQAIQQERDGSADPRPSGKSGAAKTTLAEDLRASKELISDPQTDLYDVGVLRTIFLRFPNQDWYQELGDFYRTDIDLPADLIVDGQLYPKVGVRFRGNSSYFGIRDSEKKSFNLAINFADPDQRLLDYKTLNLLNGHADPSFLREVLYTYISRHYIPAPKANFVKLIINGENWGIYINLQQFNKDFLQDQFGTRQGVRWKVSPGRGGRRSLTDNGSEIDDYRDVYQLKTSLTTEKETVAWQNLIQFCQILNHTPDQELEAKLKPVLDIDQTLWYLALENVFIDGDGYISRGSDYAIYQDCDGRFQFIPHDSNETFRFASGGGPNSWPDNDPMLDPLGHHDNPDRPLISRLLSIPRLRNRYLSYVKTLTIEWLDWEKLNPIIQAYRELIQADVEVDDKKLYSYQAFTSNAIEDDEADNRPFPPPDSSFGGGQERGPGRSPGEGQAPSFKRFAQERQAFLLDHSALRDLEPTGGHQIANYQLEEPTATSMMAIPLVVINELMADNTETISDPQGKFDDWIELYNRGRKSVDLSGMYLTDDNQNLRKWPFPAHTKIMSKGYLLIWLDEDGKSKSGLHANFKLSKNGESVSVIDTDVNNNRVLDSVTFGKQKPNVALGRQPDGTGEFKPISASPNQPNTGS